MNPDQIIERERRWALRAGGAALVASLLLIGSYLAYSQIPIESSLADQLRALDAHRGALATRSVLAGLGFILTSVPIAYLFLASLARSSRVRGGLVALCVVGPLLFGAEALVNWPALKQVSSDFVAQFPDLRQESYSALKSQIAGEAQKNRGADVPPGGPASIDKVTLYTDKELPGAPDERGVDIELKDGGLATSRYPAGDEGALVKQLDDAGVDHEEDSSGSVGDVLATQIQSDSTGVKIASGMSLLAALTLIVAMTYTPLQAMRVGLLTRFIATVGMALGVGLVLLPIPQITLAFGLWLGWLGLIFLNRVPRERPPAWDAGEAVPWLGPADRPPERPDGTIEGTASEVGENDATQPAAAPRKRKRRR